MKSLERFINRVLLLVFILAVVGCNPAQPTPTEVLSTSTPLPAATATAATFIPEPIETLDFPTPPPTVIVDIPVEQKCLTVEESVPKDLGLTGIWVRDEAQPYLENVVSQISYGIPFKGNGTLSNTAGDMAISPDGKWLAYIDSTIGNNGTRTNGRILRLINSSGHSWSLDYWQQDMQWIVGWSDNEHIILILNASGSDTRKVGVLNPFTREWSDLPFPSTPENNHQPDIYYSPLLDQLVVTTYSEVEFRNAQPDSVLWKGDPGWYSSNTVQWSPDGSSVVITTNNNDILHLLKNGKEMLYLPVSRVGSNRSYDSFSSFRWSSDGQNLLISTYSNKLLFLDLSINRIMDLCFADASMYYGWSAYSPPFWSPDNLFIVGLALKDSPFEMTDMVIDFNQLRAFKLPTSQYYRDHIGWLAVP